MCQIFVSLSMKKFFGGMELRKDGLSSKKKFTPPNIANLRLLISLLKKAQMCYGVAMTILLPECHKNQSTWSEIDQDLFDRVGQFILELVRSFGLQVHKALSLTDNLTWAKHGSPHFGVDYFHSRNAYYMQQAVVASLFPTQDDRHWWELELKERLHTYLRANCNRFAHNGSGPWKDAKSDSALDLCVAYFFKLGNFDLSDNKSPRTFRSTSLNTRQLILLIFITLQLLEDVQLIGIQRFVTMLLQACIRAETVLIML